MRYIYSESTDPYWNLALEQYIFDCLDQSQTYFMLWQNDNAIIVGKHQNTAAEINAAYVREHDIKVVRRLSGGGAVYHDLGNVNFTFISHAEKFDFSTFCASVIQALATLGVTAEMTERNDMTIEGKKFSGNAMYMSVGRVMHHGTIMYDSDLRVLAKALCVSKDKIESKGIRSVASRVTNVKPFMSEDMPVEGFIDVLRGFMHRTYGLTEYRLTPEDLDEICKLRDTVYSQWDWNYGTSPRYSIQKSRRFEGCGTIELYMDVKQKRIQHIEFRGDFFGNGNLQMLQNCLEGCRLLENELYSALNHQPVDEYFHNLAKQELISLLLMA